jgi:hypothetical protein
VGEVLNVAVKVTRWLSALAHNLVSLMRFHRDPTFEALQAACIPRFDQPENDIGKALAHPTQRG